MKKILLTLGLFALVLVGRSQVVLNEVYSNPGSGNSQFVELFNSSTSGAQNIDCFTMLTYWSDGTNQGWYVLDFPAVSIASQQWYTLAAASPFNVQAQTGINANLNWNDATFRGGSTGGYLKKYQVSGTGYTEVNINTPLVTITDLLVTGSGFYTGQNNLTLLFYNGSMINGFWGGGPNGTLPVGITGMPDLTGIAITGTGCAASTFAVDFSTLGAVEYKNASGGSDNGYARSCDGRCGTWNKTSSSTNHTPNATNGSLTSCVAGSITTATEFIGCTTPRYVQADITGVSGDVTEANDFPVEIQAWADVNGNQLLDGSDVYLGSAFQSTVAQSAVQISIGTTYQNNGVMVAYKTARGCFDIVHAVANTCAPLPVNFKSFTAVRSGANVMLKWETMTELNNTGFAIERKTSSGWEQVTFIASQALNGNSNSLLTYTYVDANSFKGISQYRIRQVDFDSRSTTSEVRAVRGENNKIQLLVYPNPSNNGTVNVVFEDVSSIRDVSLVDMAGRVVSQMKGVTNNNIQYVNLMPGVYSLRVIDRGTGEQSVQKIVVNKR